MSELSDLYQEVLLDHYRSPRNRRKMDGAARRADGFNPLCGDRVTIFLNIEEDRVRDASFEGSGCAISTAAASLMTESVKGKSREEVESLFRRFHELVTSAPDSEPSTKGLGKLALFAGVREFPIRIKCAILAWHTLQAALHDRRETVSTEGPEI